jgi:hypothetical protein
MSVAALPTICAITERLAPSKGRVHRSRAGQIAIMRPVARAIQLRLASLPRNIPPAIMEA